MGTLVVHDRIHARRPTHDVDRWSVGTIEAMAERDGHCVFQLRTEDGETVECVVTFAIRDLVTSRLDGDDPVGERVWFHRHGG